MNVAVIDLSNGDKSDKELGLKDDGGDGSCSDRSIEWW